MRLFFSGLRKIGRRPVMWGLLGLLMFQLVAGLVVGATTTEGPDTMAGQARLLVSFPGAYDGILAMFGRFAGLYAALFGAAIAGSEWTWGTLKSAIARGESRARYVTTLYGSIATIIALWLAIFFAVGAAGAVLASTLSGASTAGASDAATLGRLPEQFLRSWFAIVAQGALGFAIATLTRSQLAGVGVAIGLYLGETVFGAFLPDVVQFLPFDAAAAALSTAARSGSFGSLALGGGVSAGLGADAAAIVVGAWLIGALAVAGLVTERAEITG